MLFVWQEKCKGYEAILLELFPFVILNDYLYRGYMLNVMIEHACATTFDGTI